MGTRDSVGAFTYNICSIEILKNHCAILDLVWYFGVLGVTLCLGISVYRRLKETSENSNPWTQTI